MSPKPVIEERYKQHLVGNCLVIVLEPNSNDDVVSLTEEVKTSPGNQVDTEGFTLFSEFKRQNLQCYWNPCLMQAVSSLEYKGYFQPYTLLVASTELCMEVIRSAWMRRLLRSPRRYNIQKVGDVNPVEMIIVPQTQFAPLADTLCKVVCELNTECTPATKDTIADRLRNNFSEMVVPSDDIMHQTLGGLIRDRKLYHAGSGYHIVTPDTYSATSSSPVAWERQMLMTNEEAIVRLLASDTKTEKWKNRAVQVDVRDVINGDRPGDKVIIPSESCSKLERSHSMRLQRDKEKCGLDVRDGLCRFNSLKVSTKRNDGEDGQKRDKISMFCKLFKRCHSRPTPPIKYATFSTQFPPPEWSDPNCIFLQSQGTQTNEKDVHSITKVRRRSRHGVHRERRSLHSPKVDCRIHHPTNFYNDTPTRSCCKSTPRKSYPSTETECPGSRQLSPVLNNRPSADSNKQRRKQITADKLNNASECTKYVEKQKQLNITNNELTDSPSKYSRSRQLDETYDTTYKPWKIQGKPEGIGIIRLSHDRNGAGTPESDNNNALNSRKTTPTKEVAVDNSVDFEVSVYPRLTWEKQIPVEQTITKKQEDSSWCQTVSGKTSINRTTARPATLTTVTSITTCVSPGTPKPGLGSTRNRQKPP